MVLVIIMLICIDISNEQQKNTKNISDTLKKVTTIYNKMEKDTLCNTK